MDDKDRHQLSALTADIVSAYVSNNNVRAEDVAALISDVHAALMRAPAGPAQIEPEPQAPAVPVRKSVTPEHIVCLEDGKTFKSLKRHLRNEHGMTPEAYREKWGLKKDYPMVAPVYSESRSSLAKSMGLGRKRSTHPVAETDVAPTGEDAAAAAPAKRGRRAKASPEVVG